MKGIIMSKTIIITTDELKRLLNIYFKDSDSMKNMFCRNCYIRNNDMCKAIDNKCPYTEDEYSEYFIETVFVNYMIPFS